MTVVVQSTPDNSNFHRDFKLLGVQVIGNKKKNGVECLSIDAVYILIESKRKGKVHTATLK